MEFRTHFAVLHAPPEAPDVCRGCWGEWLRPATLRCEDPYYLLAGVQRVVERLIDLVAAGEAAADERVARWRQQPEARVR